MELQTGILCVFISAAVFHYKTLKDGCIKFYNIVIEYYCVQNNNVEQLKNLSTDIHSKYSAIYSEVNSLSQTILDIYNNIEELNNQQKI